MWSYLWRRIRWGAPGVTPPASSPGMPWHFLGWRSRWGVPSGAPTVAYTLPPGIVLAVTTTPTIMNPVTPPTILSLATEA